MSKNIVQLILNEFVIDFQPVYNFGRQLPYHSTTGIEYFSINNPKFNIELKSQLSTVVHLIIQLIKKTTNKFHPAFIELSLFDPKDRTGNIFSSVLMSDKEVTVNRYLNQMQKNRTDNPDRGPIIPHEKLHNSAFYFYQEKNTTEDKTLLKFTELSDIPEFIYIGRFDAPNEKVKTDREMLKKYISQFFYNLTKLCFTTLNEENGKYIFNSSILIPIFRPAALFKGEQENIYNGGGIFIFGNVSSNFNKNEFVLEIQTIITKSIFKASHAQIAFDEADSYNSYFTATIIHQLKRKLSNYVINILSKLIEKNHLSAEIEEDINGTKEKVENIINKLDIFLNNFQSKHKDNVCNTYTYKDFEKTIKEISADTNIAIDIFNNDSECYVELMIRKDDFDLIVDEIFQNALSYYKVNDVPDNKRNMIVHWNIAEENKILQLSFCSENTKMLSTVLENFGNKIISGTYSTGLGGFLMNYALEQCGACRFPNGIFINPKNTENGFLVEINFIIK
ncbi:MAG: hypothetical protein NTX61_03195 [Bacteroidetes bacterium]|nr:hypothetical protein [Bacteroidota bacterium]